MLTNQTLFDGLAKLSSERIPLALGFEEVLKARFSDPPTPDPRFSVEPENKTVREILQSLCALDTRYTWSSDGDTANVYPIAVRDDSTYLLNRRISRLHVEQITDIVQGLLAVAKQLPPPEEQIAQAQAGGDDSYPPVPWTAAFEDVTVRQAINRLAAHMGPRSAWLFQGSRDFRTFAFFKAGFNPRLQ